jgi:hypothetical protein
MPEGVGIDLPGQPEAVATGLKGAASATSGYLKTTGKIP